MEISPKGPVPDIMTFWSGLNFVPSTSNCTLTTYEFGIGTDSNILLITIDDGTRKFTGSGLLDAD
ncbi:MAG: hypothetical protein ACI9P5_004595 [Saprospiraceae bacterium]|jgi:hypothetical protein